MKQIGSLELAIAIAFTVTMCQGLLVIGPNLFRSNRNYTVVLSNFDSHIGDVEVELRMDGYTYFGSEALRMTKTAVVNRDSNSVVTFEVPPNLPVGRYKLSIYVGKNSTQHKGVSLIYLDKSISGLIQLNKPVYKPGDTVLFRVIVLDVDLKPPVDVDAVLVTVEDPNGNVIRKWTKGRLHVGVFEGDLQISPVPTLGPYKIVVTSNGTALVSKCFEVIEYVLSSFNVDVFPAEIPLLDDQQLTLNVGARFYTGQPVEGTAKVDLYLDDDILHQSKTIHLHGQGQVKFIFDESFYIEEDQQIVLVNLSFTEKNTNRTIVKQERIEMYKYEYQVELVPNIRLFHHGFPVNCNILVQYHDGMPAEAVEAVLKVTQSAKNSDIVAKSSYLRTSDGSGMIKLSVDPSQLAENIDILVTIDGNELLSERISKIEGESTFIQLDPAIVTNTSVDVVIKCNEKMPFFMYYVLSKGNIVDSGFVRPNRVTKYRLQLNDVGKMIPKAKIIVATVLDKIVLFDVTDVIFEQFRNNLNLQLRKKEIKPGSPIGLEINGNAGAYVALAAYDKSLLQHGKHHDLFWEDILNTFNEFHDISTNEYDLIYSIGLFARSFGETKLPFGHDHTARDGSYRRSKYEKRRLSYRSNFLESWMWKNLTIGEQGHSKLRAVAPDTTTAWQLTGFSVDPVLGLGIIKRPIEFTTTQQFYIVDTLPYSIKRGEAVVLQFFIFNNFDTDLTASVTLYNVENQTEIVGSPGNGESYTKNISATAKAGVPVSFLVKPRKLGEMTVHVRASSDGVVDAIKRFVRVEPESLLMHAKSSRLLCHDTYINQTYTFDLPLRVNADAGSQKVLFTITPNLLAPVVQNLEELLSVPTGCGEQNMVRLVPNIVVLDYLTAIGSKNQELLDKATALLRTGYQNQQKYRQSDGSFGVWGSSGGSVFLTSFVGKSLQSASKYISEVDSGQISKAYEWLASKQHSSGRFDEVGQVIHKDMQGGLRNGIALTAYVLSAFLEHPETAKKHATVIDRGIKYITDNLQHTEDSYDLSIATYALMLHGHSLKDSFLLKLIGMSKTEQNGTELYWDRSSGSIETTAYALLSFVISERYMDGTSIMRWLVKKRYVTGSFPRTQDTFVGLRALTKLAEKISPSRNDYTVQLRRDELMREFRVHSLDLSVLTYEARVQNVSRMAASVFGIGFGLMDLHYDYSVDLRNSTNRFNLELEKELSNSGAQLNLRVCASFIPVLSDSLSNMVLVEVNFPSGYAVERNPISKASSENPIQNTEIRFAGTSVVVYYNNMGTERNCFTVTATRQTEVALKRPAYVLVHDYYQPELKAIKMYEVDSLDICDICEREDCPPSCSN